MHVVVVYESMYGNTHTVANEVAEGLRTFGEVTEVPRGEATADVVDGADLVVVGGPTHVHGLTSKTSRKGAVGAAEKDPSLEVEPDAEGPGLREWFHSLTGVDGTQAAAFDTRIDAPPALTGRASKGIARRLRHHGFDLVVEPESFLVDKENHLEPGEAERAREWGVALGRAASHSN